jgi:hypothetical protein
VFVLLNLCTFIVAWFDNLVRCTLSVKLDAKVARISRLRRGAPVDAVTLLVGVFWYCRVFDVQICSDGRSVVMYDYSYETFFVRLVFDEQ